MWRPSAPGSVIYNKIGEVQLQSDDQVTQGYNNFEATIILTGENRTEFQSGDVIGYHHPRRSRYQVKDISTNGYILYRFNESPAPSSVNLSAANGIHNYRQPLLQFTVGNNVFVNFIIFIYYIIIL